MRFGIAIVFIFLAAVTISAQPHRLHSAEIKRAQTVRVSSFDPALPNLTLQSFLRYETDHAQIDWSANRCSDDRKNAICVRAESAVNDQISVFITVEVLPSLNALPKLVSVEVTERGLVHRIRLIELPAATHGHRFRSREIRDIPPELSTAG